MNKNINKIFIITFFLIMILSKGFNVYANEDIAVDGKAALIVETHNGKIIYEKNADEIIFPASLTKILTAIIVLENCNLDDVAIVSKNAISNIPTGYVVAPLYEGEKIKVKDLLYALLLESANDAAYVLAEHVGNSVEEFSNIMNKKAQEIGCKNTHFINPNGIHNENHYTTAYDLYLISNYAMKNDTFSKIVSTYQYTLPDTNKYSKKDRVMTNRNYFVNPNSKFYNKNVNGIKTGTTTEAGNCVITNVKKDELEIITIILGAETYNSRFSETKKMIEYAFENYAYAKLHEKGDIIKKIEVKNATEDTKNLNLAISEDITVIKNVKTNISEIEPEIILNENISAPIEEGQELGTVKYNVDGIEYTAKLIAEKNVELRTYYKEILIVIGTIMIIVILFKRSRKKFNK